jgi:hypothetical protein
MDKTAKLDVPTENYNTWGVLRRRPTDNLFLLSMMES